MGMALAAFWIYFSVFGGILREEVRKAGTDSAGYSILAKQIRGGDFSTTLENRELENLILSVVTRRDGSSKNVPETGLAPTSFRYNHKIGRHLSQYPIGTSVLLALTPANIEIRSLVIIYAYFISVIFFHLLIRSTRARSRLACATVFTLYFTYLWYARSGIYGSFSIYPSIILSLCAGLAIGFGSIRFEAIHKPDRQYMTSIFFSAFLIGLSCIFRISNGLLFLPLVAILITQELANHAKREARESCLINIFSSNSYMLGVFLCFSIGALFGLIPIMFSNIQISAYPIFTNYPSYDKEVLLHPFSIAGNIEILTFRGGLDGFLGIASLFSVLLSIEKNHTASAKTRGLTLISILIMSILLVSSKVVVASYYLTPLFSFLIAFSLYSTTAFPLRTPKPLVSPKNLIALIGFPAVLIALCSSPYIFSGKFFNDQLNSVPIRMASFIDPATSVVWSNEESGFVYNNYGIHGFSYYRLAPDLRLRLVRELNDYGIDQYVEKGVNMDETLSELGLTLGCQRFELNHVKLSKVC